MSSMMLAFFLCVGVVDRVEDDIASVQVVANDQSVHDFDMSTLMFPCEIKEGDTFYFIYSRGRTEIRCGQPPEESEK